MPQKYVVQLGDGDRQQLLALLRRGRSSARALIHARILLAADDGLSDEEIAEQSGLCQRTVFSVRQRFARAGLTNALHRRPQPARPEKRKLDGAGEAHLIALACGAPPDGQQHWTLRLLADRMVALNYADSLSYETVRTTLKKTS
jgi:transposase